MFIKKKSADYYDHSCKHRFAVALFTALILFFVLNAPLLQAEPLNVAIAPSGTIKLPPGWVIMDSALLAEQLKQAKGSAGMPISSNTAFLAAKNNPSGEQIAVISLERTQPAPLNSNILPLLSQEEKRELFNSIRMVVLGAFNQAEPPLDITDITTKTFGRYNTIIVSGKQNEGHNPMDFHLVYYFLTNETHIFSVAYRSDFAKSLNQDFSLIMDSFDPDKTWRPTPPPERKPGEALHDYLSRIYGVEQTLPGVPPAAVSAQSAHNATANAQEAAPSPAPPASNAEKTLPPAQLGQNAAQAQPQAAANLNATQTMPPTANLNATRTPPQTPVNLNATQAQPQAKASLNATQAQPQIPASHNAAQTQAPAPGAKPVSPQPQINPAAPKGQ